MIKKLLLILILGSVFCVFSGGCVTNAVTGESEFNIYGNDMDDDVRLGEAWAPELEKEFGGVFEDEHIQSYVDYVGQNVAQVSHGAHIPWHFRVLRDKMMNAFALPGGYIYITTGMLRKLETEAQLAGILAHEASHVTLRHSTNRMSEQMGFNILFSAAMRNASGEMVRAASIASQLVMLKYSREDEMEADVIGLRYAMRAGYNPYGMVETMQILEAERNDDGPAEFLSSHPSPMNRYGRLLEEIEAGGYNVAEMKVRKEDYERIVLERLKDVKDEDEDENKKKNHKH
ncbi:MAG: M48 family metalloprotease [Planctomycetes bacterium]|nr:M48 family metalloprotease [Planctomycetota bacterium]